MTSVKYTLIPDRDGDSSTDKEYTEVVDDNHTTTCSPPSRRRQLLLVLSCCYLRSVCAGLGFALSVVYVKVIEHFQAPRSHASLIQSMYTISLHALSFFVSFIVTRYGPGVSVIVGAVLAATGFLLSAFLLGTNIAGVIICTGVITGFGMSIISIASWTAATWSFRENKSLALLITSCGASVGMFVFPVIAEVSIEHFKLQGAFIVLSCISSTAIAVGVGFHTSRHYFDRGDSIDGARNLSFFRLPMFWVCQLCNVLVAFAFADPYVLVDMVVEYGFSRTKGAYAETILGVSGLFGKLSSMGLTRIRNLPTIAHWSYCCLVIGAGHLLLSRFHEYWLVMVVSAVSGVSYGISSSIGPVIMLETVGLERFPQAQGFGSVAWGAGAFAGISCCGSLKDNGWNYDHIYYLLTGILGLVSVISLAVAIHWRRKH